MRSRTVTATPARASTSAAIRPAGPPPTTLALLIGRTYPTTVGSSDPALDREPSGRHRGVELVRPAPVAGDHRRPAGPRMALGQQPPDDPGVVRERCRVDGVQGDRALHVAELAHVELQAAHRGPAE